MENFIFKNPTKIIFGKDTHKDIGKEVKKYSNRVLFHYGMGSIKRSGLYDEIIASLKQEGIDVFELGGVKPNPILGLTVKGSLICRENNIDFILAVGGGSVIDSAKAIALNVPYEGESMWDFLTGRAKPVSALPVGVVVTIPAAGSESSDVTVITNEEGMIKRGYHHELIRPVFAVLDPELTYTLPVEQLSSGAADIMAHVMERYFTRTRHVDLTDRLCEATLKTVIENAPLVLENPKDYNPRAELMWASTLAHNDLLSTGRIGDWGSHKIAHELSTYCGVPHGAAMAIIFPAWMKYVYKIDIEIFYKFAVRVFDVDPCFGTQESIVLKGIERLVSFFKSLGLPASLKDIGVGEEGFEEMAERAMLFGPIGKYMELNKQDVLNIYKLAL
ncbi:MAG: iron-containing alcohol dehydrogenase [Actinomycetota bacterium]|nr:MAG: iron-containing alcohol dehydrogenase [Actinomycetota bacterium]